MYGPNCSIKSQVPGLIMIKKKTLVLGASENATRTSFLAVQKLIAKGHPVIAIGKRTGRIGTTTIETEQKLIPEVDTVTIYLNPEKQASYYSYILSLHPKRLIFNPGAENPELFSLALNEGINCLNACTLVLLSTGQY